MVAIMNPKFDGHDMLRECTPDSSTLVDKESNRYPKKIAWLHLELNWSSPEKKNSEGVNESPRLTSYVGCMHS